MSTDFRPMIVRNEDGRQLECFIDNSPYYAVQIDSRLAVYCDQQTNRIIGLVVDYNIDGEKVLCDLESITSGEP